METAKFIAYVFFAAFAGVVPPGLVNMTVAKVALNKDKKNAVYSAIGVCVVNFIHAFVSVLMARYIIRHTAIKNNMLKIGVLVFAVLTIYFLFVALKNKPAQTGPSKKDSRKSFVKGFFIANLNILPIPYFVFISTQLGSKTLNVYDWSHVFLFALSAASGTFTILYIYILTVLKLDQRTKDLTKYANYFMAVLMFILFIITLIRLYNA